MIDDPVIEEPVAEPVETSLRDDIKAAVAEVEAQQAPDSEPGESGRLRDASGKFAAKAAEPVAEPEATPTEVVEPEAAPAPEGPPAPQAWRADEKAAWDKIPPEGRAAILRREHDVSQAMGRMDNERQWGRAIAPVFTPYMEAIRAANAEPAQVVKGLLETQWKLHTGKPEEKVAMIHQICRDFGVDIVHAANNAPPPVDPTLAALQREVAELRTRVSQPANDPSAGLASEVETFMADPKNVHFEALRPMMGALLDSGVVGDLQEAYDRALWASPDLRSTMLDAERRNIEAKQAARVAEARRAAVSLPGASGSPKPTGTNETSLRDDLRSAFRQAVGVA